MNCETRDRIEQLLHEALALLDRAGAHLSAIHVSQALEALGRAVSSSENRPDGEGEP